MQKPTRLALLFNGGALLIALASGAAVLRSIFVPDAVAPCSTRYAHGTELALENPNGELLTTADLQARFGGTDWGLLDNARVVQVKGDASRQAIEVRLIKAAGKTAPSAEPRLGMGFTWMPKSIGHPSAACLAYSVQMARGLDFARGGRFPGFLAAAPSSTSTTTDASVSSGWGEKGRLEVRVQLPGGSNPRALTDQRNDYVFPRGQWIALEQEVVLNTPGQKDGALRVWADGTLLFENTGLVLRDGTDVGILGVIAEVMAYGAETASPGARENKVWFSPLELRWQ